MGELNLLKGAYTGKVGKTVGAKWKNISTVRTFTKPANPKTEAQVSVRSAFKDINSFVARFADAIKYLSAWNTAGMSVRNAIVKANKAMIDTGTFDKDTLQISKGGLAKPTALAGTWSSSAGGTIGYTWTKPIASNISADAKMVIIAVDEINDLFEVLDVKASAETATGAVNFPSTAQLTVYGYILDKHGSVKVASNSVKVTLS